jgi:MoaA/NifB/PqqE/SkfB family radical SAM enzyme
MRVTAKQHFIDGLRRSASALWSRLRATGPRRAPLGVEIPLELVLEQRAEEPSLPEPPVVRDTFCVLAWNHLQIAPNGTVKMCCIASEDIHDKGRPMSLYTDTYEEIWNSEYMRDARRGMANGEMISPCMRCYQEEDSVGQSRRTTQNRAWLGKTGKVAEDFIAEGRDRSWMVRDRPGILQLNMGNLCNLACRMCSSQYSSRIESDPVHNKWMPAAYPGVARWRGKRLHFGPRPFFGVSYSGFYAYEVGGGYALRWSNGAGIVSFEIPVGTNVSRVGLSLRTVGGTNPVVIRLNGLEIFSGQIGPDWKQEFDTPGLTNQPTLELAIESAAVDVGGRQLGVALLDAWVERKQEGTAPSSNERALTRSSTNKGWWADETIMFDEILGQPESLECITFQGGEPLLVKEFDRILDLLIERGIAANVIFEIISNMTSLKDSTLQKLSQLKHVILGVSIDGIGDVLEYIRYPAKWSEIEANIARAIKLPNLSLNFNTAVQLYNLHHITDILRYCDAHDINVNTHFIVGPRYLNVLVLPPISRQVVVEHLRAYLAGDGARPVNRGSAEYMITFLMEHAETHYRDDFDTFVRFTNDLDVSRSQSFRESYPHLVEWFAQASQIWFNETVYGRGMVRDRQG